MVLVPRSRVQEYVAVAVPKKQDEQRVRAGFNAKKKEACSEQTWLRSANPPNMGNFYFSKRYLRSAVFLWWKVAQTTDAPALKSEAS